MVISFRGRMVSEEEKQREEKQRNIIRRELKFANFEYDKDEKTIMIETRTTDDAFKRISNARGEFTLPRPINGRIKLNKVYSFALLRFVIRIAQHNWMRKLKR